MRPLPLIVLCFVLAGAGCSDSNGLPDPTFENIERTDTLWALVGTPVSTPSGYALDGGRRIRTDLSVEFDFAYNIENEGRHVFLPRAALGIDTANAVNPGLQPRDESFEAITSAPGDGYITDEPVPIAVGQRYVARSRVTCALGVPKYGKLEIIELDEVTRMVAFRVLINDNCGFRSLEPGLPDR
ncbi:MAG: hypothetical protein ACREMZ_03760 [Gemmatimonadales bacterium]